MLSKQKLRLILALVSCSGLTTPVSATADISPMIFNGIVTSTDEWPSIAAIYFDAAEYGKTSNTDTYCTGSILDQQHILTAAHCLYDGSEIAVERLTFTSAVLQMNDVSEAINGLILPIKAAKFYAHPNFVNSGYSESVPWPNDIAIIKLEQSINIDSSAYVIRANTAQASSYRQTSESFVAVGYGQTETGESGSLLQTDLRYETQENCSLSAGDSQICTQGDFNDVTQVRNSICSGDSGGPLFWFDDGQYHQIGVTSYGWNGCYNDQTDDTSVFIEVADYSNWIESVLSGNEPAVFSVTEQDRIDYFSDDDKVIDFFTTSNESGGSLSFKALLLLMVVRLFRRINR